MTAGTRGVHLTRPVTASSGLMKSQNVRTPGRTVTLSLQYFPMLTC